MSIFELRKENQREQAAYLGQLKTMVNIRDEKIEALKYEIQKLQRLNMVYRSRLRSLEHDNFKLHSSIVAAGGETKPDISTSGILKEIINKYYGINIDFRIRQRTVVTGRVVYYTLLRKYTALSLKEMSLTLACKPHHSTIIWALQSHEDLIKYDKKYQKGFIDICKMVEVQMEIQTA